jgi:enterochelin esterase-like enzyme
MDLPCSMVAQVLIDSGLSAGIVTVPMAVHHVESFSCVGMIEPQAITKPIGRTRMRDGDHQRAEDRNKKRILEIVATQEITTSLQTDSRAVRILPSRKGMFVALAHG